MTDIEWAELPLPLTKAIAPWDGDKGQGIAVRLSYRVLECSFIAYYFIHRTNTQVQTLCITLPPSHAVSDLDKMSHHLLSPA